MSGQERDEPVTLAPLSPEEALRALLKVKPEDDEPDQDDEKAPTG